MTNTRTIQLPFSGFYGTIWESAIDNCLEEFSQYNSDELNDDNYDGAQVPSLDFCENLIFDNTNFAGFRQSVAKKYLSYFKDALSDDCYLELDLSSLEFKVLDSPREYNHSNDDLYATISDNDAQKLFDVSAKDNHKKLREIVATECSHRNGFISHYSNDLGKWLEKPLAEWDHNELGMLLQAVCQYGDFSDGVERQIFEDWPDGFNSEFEASVDWPVVNAALEAFRAQNTEKGE